MRHSHPIAANELHEKLLEWRGVETPCDHCAGAGRRSYSSTATWHGGIGGQMFTSDVCDKCWGTGDKHTKGYDLRALTAQRAQWEEDEVFNYLVRRFGVELDRFKQRWSELADYCDKQANKRKIPDGEEAFWWSADWQAMGSMIRRMVK